MSVRSANANNAGTACWVGTWACAPQRIDASDLPPSPGLGGNVLRQVVRLSVGGCRMRLRFSNLFGDGPVTLSSVQAARSLGAFAIDPTSDRALSFAGSSSVALEPGATIWSDPLEVSLPPLTKLSVTISGAFDALIDLDAAVRDPNNPAFLLPDYDSGDHLHLNVAGYRARADAIDLGLFSR